VVQGVHAVSWTREEKEKTEGEREIHIPTLWELTGKVGDPMGRIRRKRYSLFFENKDVIRLKCRCS